MRPLFLLFLILCGFSSCSTEINRIPEPKNLIPQEKFEAILYDLMLVESHVQTKIPNLMEFKYAMKNSGAEILKKHALSFDEFDASMNYYASRQTLMQEIYSSIQEKMNVELNELQTGKKKS